MNEQKKPVGVALLGLGTVGGGTYKLLQMRREEIEQKVGCPVEVRRILVRNASKKREGVDPALLTDNFEEILQDSTVDVVVELMGGLEPAGGYITKALQAGKQVVTANKDLIAARGSELFALADAQKLDLRFEAAVAGGIPVLTTLLQGGLTGNSIEEVIGIVNGTTNFILTKMTRMGMDFEEALAEATRLGYAEADPTADVDGLDAARKCAILATLAFHSPVTPDKVMTEGIRKITAADIRYAREMGYVIKLLAIARETEEHQVVTSVYPALISEDHPLAAVNNSFNAVYVTGDAVGDTMFYGRGAGEMPTASAVVGDILQIAENIQKEATGRNMPICYRNLEFKPMGEIRNRFFLRMRVQDRPGMLAAVANIFGIHNVSIKQLKQNVQDDNMAELIIVTEKVREIDFSNAIRTLTEMQLINGVSNIIRVHGKTV